MISISKLTSIEQVKSYCQDRLDSIEKRPFMWGRDLTEIEMVWRSYAEIIDYIDGIQGENYYDLVARKLECGNWFISGLVGKMEPDREKAVGILFQHFNHIQQLKKKYNSTLPLNIEKLQSLFENTDYANVFLQWTKPIKLDNEAILTILKTTYIHKDNLPARCNFWDRCLIILKIRLGSEEAELLLFPLQ